MAQKREIDKEAMFRKIMPSSAAAGEDGLSAMPEAPPMPVETAAEAAAPEVSSRSLSADEIAAMFAQTQPEVEAPEAPPLPAQAAAEAAAPEVSSRSLSADEIAAMFAQTQPETEVPGPAVEAAAPALAEPEPAPPQPVLAEPQPEPTPPPAEIPSQPEALAAEPAPAAPPQAASAPGAEDGPPPRAINLAEVYVQQVYPRYLKRLNGCTCDRCRDDSCGLALNRVRPRYVPSHMMDKNALFDRELATEATAALVKAIFIIKRNPHHEDLVVS